MEIISTAWTKLENEGMHHAKRSMKSGIGTPANDNYFRQISSIMHTQYSEMQGSTGSGEACMAHHLKKVVSVAHVLLAQELI